MRIIVPIIALFALMHTAGPISAAEPASAKVQLLVPAYFYPAGEGITSWKTLLAAPATAHVVAIVNPDSGPGKRADNNYRELFKTAKSSSAKLIGYVTLSYAQRPISAIKADIDSWLYFYPDVQGIFFDEQPSGAEHAAFAIECFAYARQRIDGAIVVSNPGVVCAREYLAGDDGPTVCMFEHHEGFEKYQLPEWAEGLPRNRFCVLLYGVESADEMRAAMQSAIAKRSGYIYITDRAGPMPWDRLPIYWKEEVESVIDGNRPPVKEGSK